MLFRSNAQRPLLERRLSQLLGHPLRLGPFERLGLAGLEVGPTRLLPTTSDLSRVDAGGLRLRFDPLASWQLGGPVLQLDLRDVRADLRRDASGAASVIDLIESQYISATEQPHHNLPAHESS